MIEIKITGNTPLEALASLTAFGLRCISDPAVNAAANRILEAEQAKERKEAAKVSNLDTTPTNPQASADPPPEPYIEESPHSDPAPAPEDQPKPPTLVEVRAKGVEAAKRYGQAAVKTILDGFGVPSMTALAEGDRAAFLVKLAELESQGDDNA